MSLTTKNHDRDAAGLLYVYPVLSRRARGVSVGINLNPNRACNFRCIYCQVPGLSRGSAPVIDLPRLESELYQLLEGIVHGTALHELAPQGLRRLNDVAFSGDGEPTSCSEFPEVVERVQHVLADLRILKRIKIILITNGSLMHRSHVQEGLAALAPLNGEVWFKIDRGTELARQAVNDTTLSQSRLLKNLETCASLCKTRIQTCWFAIDGEAPPDSEISAYVDLLHSIRASGIAVQDVLLYGLARPSHQPEAPRLSALSAEAMEGFAERIRETGFPVEVSP